MNTATARKLSRKIIETVESIFDLTESAGFQIHNVFNYGEGSKYLKLTLKGSVQSVFAIPGARISYGYKEGTAKYVAEASVVEGARRIEIEYFSDEFPIECDEFTVHFTDEVRNPPAGVWIDGTQEYRVAAGERRITVARTEKSKAVEWFTAQATTQAA